MFPDPKSIFLRQSRKKAVKKKIMFSEKEKKNVGGFPSLML